MSIPAPERLGPPGVEWVLHFGEDGPRVVNPSTGEILERHTKEIRAALQCAQYKQYANHAHASALAEALAGSRVSLGVDEAGQTILLDGEGNELQAGPGEGMELRASAMLLLEAQTACGAVGMHEGRIFGIGCSGSSSSLRHAPAYKRRQGIRSRRKARAALRLIRRRLACVDYDRKESGRVLPVAWTLTTPTLDPSVVPGVCEAKEEERMFLAWTLLRKRDTFKETVFAGLRGFEVTRKVTLDGIVLHHPHFHTLTWARYVGQAELAATWWDCLCVATRRVYGFELEDLYRDQESVARAVTACIQIQAVKRKTRRGDQAVSLEDAIQETLKYCTKPEDIACYVADPEHPGEWIVSGLPADYLREGIWKRSPRVFECVGAARCDWKAPKWCKPMDGVSPELLADLAGEATRQAAASCSLDTPAITDGVPVGQPSKDEARRRVTLRSLMHTLDLHSWLQIAAKRAFAGLAFLDKGLRSKGYWVLAPACGPPG